jgi:hypothetical protein
MVMGDPLHRLWLGENRLGRALPGEHVMQMLYVEHEGVSTHMPFGGSHIADKAATDILASRFPPSPTYPLAPRRGFYDWHQKWRISAAF